MIGKLLPAILAALGLGAGIGGGLVLRPPPHLEGATTAPCGEPDALAKPQPDPEAEVSAAVAHDYVKLNNQFVVPVVSGGRVKSLVVLSLSLEVRAGDRETVYQREPKLRDAFLRVLFDHANSGGFDGAFTKSASMTGLHSALRESAQKTLGPTASDVLIIDIVRQDA